MSLEDGAFLAHVLNGGRECRVLRLANGPSSAREASQLPGFIAAHVDRLFGADVDDVHDALRAAAPTAKLAGAQGTAAVQSTLPFDAAFHLVVCVEPCTLVRMTGAYAHLYAAKLRVGLTLVPTAEAAKQQGGTAASTAARKVTVLLYKPPWLAREPQAGNAGGGGSGADEEFIFKSDEETLSKRGTVKHVGERLERLKLDLREAMGDQWPPKLRLAVEAGGNPLGDVHVPLVWAQSLQSPRNKRLNLRLSGRTFQLPVARPLASSILGAGWSFLQLPAALVLQMGLPLATPQGEEVRYTAYVRSRQPPLVVPPTPSLQPQQGDCTPTSSGNSAAAGEGKGTQAGEVSTPQKAAGRPTGELRTPPTDPRPAFAVSAESAESAGLAPKALASRLGAAGTPRSTARQFAALQSDLAKHVGALQAAVAPGVLPAETQGKEARAAQSPAKQLKALQVELEAALQRACDIQRQVAALCVQVAAGERVTDASGTPGRDGREFATDAAASADAEVASADVGPPLTNDEADKEGEEEAALEEVQVQLDGEKVQPSLAGGAPTWATQFLAALADVLCRDDGGGAGAAARPRVMVPLNVITYNVLSLNQQSTKSKDGQQHPPGGEQGAQAHSSCNSGDALEDPPDADVKVAAKGVDEKEAAEALEKAVGALEKAAAAKAKAKPAPAAALTPADRAAAVAGALFSLVGGEHAVTESGWAASLSRLDVICLQEVKGPAKEQARFLAAMRYRKFDHVKHKQHVILWNCDTIERVTTQASTEPDCVWSHESALGAAWGSNPLVANAYGAELEKMRTSGKSEKDTFFRYPPITVVLRRKKTKTLYVVTTAHTPGSGPHGEDGAIHMQQLQREVKWLMDERRYRLVMHTMTERSAALKKAVGGDAGALFSTSPRKDVVHIVAGDFNTQLYGHLYKAAASRSGGANTRSQALLDGTGPPLACLKEWAAIQGSAADLSEPSTTNNYPDVVYVLRKSAEAAGLTKTGFATLAMPRQGRLYGDASDHKPVMVSLTERDQQPEEVEALVSRKEVNAALGTMVASLTKALEDVRQTAVLSVLEQMQGGAKGMLDAVGGAVKAAVARTGGRPQPKFMGHGA